MYDNLLCEKLKLRGAENKFKCKTRGAKGTLRFCATKITITTENSNHNGIELNEHLRSRKLAPPRLRMFSTQSTIKVTTTLVTHKRYPDTNPDH